jgi:hypothetical protein
MKTQNIIEGLIILRSYYDSDGYNIGAEHDVIYAYATDKPVSEPNLNKLVELGWMQPDAETGDDEDFEAKHYDQEESWAAYV